MNKIIRDIVVMGGKRATVPWYLTTGLVAADCVAAFLPRTAANFAASCVNLVNPGVHDLTATNAPALVNGWVGDGTACLHTDIVETSAYTTIVWYSGLGAAVKYLWGAYKAAGTLIRGVKISNASGSHAIRNGGAEKLVSGVLLDGIFALTDANSYLDGAADGTSIATGNTGLATYILGLNSDGTDSFQCTGTVHGWVTYNKILTQAQIQTIGTQMVLAGWGDDAYEALVQSIFGTSLVRFWPETETLSRKVYDLSGNYGNGTHQAAVSINQVAIPTGKKIPTYNGSVRTVIYSDALSAAFNPDEGTMISLAKIANTEWVDTKSRTILQFRGGNDFVSIGKSGYGYALGMTRAIASPAATSAQYFTCSGITDLMVVGVTWSKSANRITVYSDGMESYYTTFDDGWTTAPDVTYTNIGASYDGVTDKFIGAIGGNVLANRAASAAEMKALFEVLYPTTANIFVVGDSKSDLPLGMGAWVGILRQKMSDNDGVRYIEQTRFAVGGYDVGEMKVRINAQLGAVGGTPPVYILINLGANDAVQPTPEAEFIADYYEIIDALRAKWAGVPIYIAKVWRSDQEANCTTLNGYIDTIIAHYVSGVSVGLNEPVTMKAADNGATNYLDGVHYSIVGRATAATAWGTILGIP